MEQPKRRLTAAPQFLGPKRTGAPPSFVVQVHCNTVVLHVGGKDNDWCVCSGVRVRVRMRVSRRPSKPTAWPPRHLPGAGHRCPRAFGEATLGNGQSLGMWGKKSVGGRGLSAFAVPLCPWALGPRLGLLLVRDPNLGLWRPGRAGDGGVL